jgi:hypothetical protein
VLLVLLLLLLLLLAATSAYSVSTMGQSNEPVQQFVILVYVHMSCAPAGAAANSVDGVANRVAGVAGVAAAAAAAAGGSVSLQLQHIQGGWDLVPNTCTAYCTDAWACPMLLQVLLRSVWMVQPTVLLVLLLLAVT